MGHKDTVDRYASDLRARLRQIMGDTPQREFARKLGIPSQSLNGYLNTTMPPAWICSHLVKELGVNPSWLLSGEGEPLLADITTGTMHMAGDILELVQAMNSVARMRLGALVDKQHYAVLRELNDSLLQFKQQREAANERMVPVFSQINTDLRVALAKEELDRSASLVNAGEQVSTICDDKACSRDFAYLKSIYFHKSGDIDGFVRQQYEAIKLYVIENGRIDDEGWHQLSHFAMGLTAFWRFSQARAICDAYLALSANIPCPLPVRDYLRAVSGYLRVDTGDMHSGASDLDASQVSSRTWSGDLRKQPSLQLRTTKELIEAMSWTVAYYRGAVDYWTFERCIPSERFGNVPLGWIACWSRDDEVVAHFKKRLSGVSAGESLQYQALQATTDALSEVLKKKKGARKSVKIDFASGSSRNPAEASVVQRFIAIMEAELAFLCGKKAAVAKLVSRNEDMLLENENIHLPLLVRAIHYRNVLEVGQASTRSYDEAQNFFREYTARGYLCFASLGRQASSSV